jgi:FliA/WhiG family RNA polymerase sigma factor
MALAPEKIRNVAVVGHRGTGKTSLSEALLYQSGAINRLGAVAEGTSVCDFEEDEKRRSMSIDAALVHAEWKGHKLNLIDAPGDPSFVADALGALRVVEGALFCVSGVAGVEVMTAKLWRRCEELGIARIAFVNLLDRERADFAAAIAALQSQLSPNLVAISIPIGVEHGFRGIVDLLHMVAYVDEGDGSREGDAVPIPDDLQAQAQEWRDRLMDHVAEASDELMERYLEGEPISDDELRSLDWVPRSVRARAREIERAMAELENRFKRAPSDDEVAKEIGITLGEFQDSLTAISRTSVAALDEMWSVSASGGDSVSLIDTIEDPNADDPSKAMTQTELREALADAIGRLPEREKLVITLYYYEELTLREIGEVLGVTESRVSQLHTKAILRLKVRLHGNMRREDD